MKTRAQKREEAMLRAEHYIYENSKAKRTGKLTKAQWEEKNKAAQKKSR